jgi:hypothetical protein
MIVEFFTSGNNVYFKSKSSKKKLRDFIKKHNYEEFKLLTEELDGKIKGYLTFGTKLKYKFSDDEEKITIVFSLINPTEERKKLLKQRLKNRIKDINDGQNLAIKAREIKKQYKSLIKEKNVPKHLVDMFYQAKADKPNLKIPSPDQILKNKSFYSNEFQNFLNTFKNLDKDFVGSLKDDSYTKYMEMITGVNSQ